jgi:uncharacterized protein YebE (UPF0316 family)
MFELLMSSEIFVWVIIPLLICLARIIDVSIGTVRIIYISKGMKFLAPMMGFFEVLIWLVAITQIMKNLTHWVYYVAYALGFALGTLIGMVIEEKISVGHVMVRIITRKDPSNLIEYLKNEKCKVTIVDGKNAFGKQANVLFTIVKRKKIRGVIEAIKSFNPKAFYSVEDVKYVKDESAEAAAQTGIPASKKKMFLFSKMFQKKGK